MGISTQDGLMGYLCLILYLMEAKELVYSARGTGSRHLTMLPVQEQV